MKKFIIVSAIILVAFLSGCSKESDDDGLACGTFEIDGQMKEICVPN